MAHGLHIHARTHTSHAHANLHIHAHAHPCARGRAYLACNVVLQLAEPACLEEHASDLHRPAPRLHVRHLCGLVVPRLLQKLRTSMHWWFGEAKQHMGGLGWQSLARTQRGGAWQLSSAASREGYRGCRREAGTRAFKHKTAFVQFALHHHKVAHRTTQALLAVICPHRRPPGLLTCACA